MELEKIMENVYLMRDDINNLSLEDILLKYKDFKLNCPRLFELVLENKDDYMPILKKMEQAANLVNNGSATKKEMDILVDYRLTEEYVFPSLDMNDDVKSSIKDTLKNVEHIEKKLKFDSKI